MHFALCTWSLWRTLEMITLYFPLQLPGPFTYTFCLEIICLAHLNLKISNTLKICKTHGILSQDLSLPNLSRDLLNLDLSSYFVVYSLDDLSSVKKLDLKTTGERPFVPGSLAERSLRDPDHPHFRHAHFIRILEHNLQLLLKIAIGRLTTGVRVGTLKVSVWNKQKERPTNFFSRTSFQELLFKNFLPKNFSWRRFIWVRWLKKRWK